MKGRCERLAGHDILVCHRRGRVCGTYGADSCTIHFPGERRVEHEGARCNCERAYSAELNADPAHHAWDPFRGSRLAAREGRAPAGPPPRPQPQPPVRPAPERPEQPGRIVRQRLEHPRTPRTPRQQQQEQQRVADLNRMRALVDIVNGRQQLHETMLPHRFAPGAMAAQGAAAEPGGARGSLAYPRLVDALPHQPLVRQLLSGQDSRRGTVSRQLWADVGRFLRADHPTPEARQRLAGRVEQELSTARAERREGLTRTPRTPIRYGFSPFASTRQSHVSSPDQGGGR